MSSSEFQDDVGWGSILPVGWLLFYSEDGTPYVDSLDCPLFTIEGPSMQLENFHTKEGAEEFEYRLSFSFTLPGIDEGFNYRTVIIKTNHALLAPISMQEAIVKWIQPEIKKYLGL